MFSIHFYCNEAFHENQFPLHGLNLSDGKFELPQVLMFLAPEKGQLHNCNYF